VYDCFGAGQKVVQVIYGGQDWLHSPDIAEQMFTVFGIVRGLHELLWYLTEALTWQAVSSLHAELRRAMEETERLTHHGPETLVAMDINAHRQSVNGVLRRASELMRADLSRQDSDLRGADLIGGSFRGADLAGANLRGAYLIGADFTGADLSMVDLTGADLRGAELSKANLATSIFLTQFQVNATKGDLDTRLPPSLTPPTHWPRRRPAAQ
jgi:hypothetical protein